METLERKKSFSLSYIYGQCLRVYKGFLLSLKTNIL